MGKISVGERLRSGNNTNKTRTYKFFEILHLLLLCFFKQDIKNKIPMGAYKSK